MTWSDPIIIDVLFGSASQGQGVIDPSDGAPVRTGDILPEVAADPRRGSEALHIVWQDIRFTLAAPLPYWNDQIVISSSTDGGFSWSDARRVSENKLTQAFTGSVEVDERGAIGVSYYDFTADDPAGGPLETDYWFTAARNADSRFSPRTQLTRRPFDMRTAPDAGGFFVGDYEGLATAGRLFHNVFVTARDGNLNNRTDVFGTSLRASFARVQASRVRGARARASAKQFRQKGLARIAKAAGGIRGPVSIR